jgi:sulfofructose kinase
VQPGGVPGQVAAPSIQARDTTGAGDVFHAALGLALVEGRSIADAVAWANAAAACKCERGGGAEGAPTRPQLTRWLARRTPRSAAASAG